MVHHDIAVEGRDDAVVEFLELDIGVVEGLQTGEIAVGEFLILFVVEVACVEQGVGCQQIRTESQAVAVVDVCSLVSYLVQLQRVCDAVCVNVIVERTDAVLLVRMWVGAPVFEVQGYVHGDIDLSTALTGVGHERNQFLVELVVADVTQTGGNASALFVQAVDVEGHAMLQE